MASDRATQLSILEAITQRLRQRVPDLSEVNTFVSDQRQPVKFPSDRLCCTITPGPGRFDEALWAGGGQSQICETLDVLVTLWLQNRLDAIPRATNALLGERGILSWYKPHLLRALLLEDLGNGSIDAWMPVGQDGMGLLRNYLRPVSCSSPMPEQTQSWIGMTLTLEASFDWML